jgi:hypothetical protein
MFLRNVGKYLEETRRYNTEHHNPEKGKESSGNVGGEVFLDQLSDFQLLK